MSPENLEARLARLEERSTSILRELERQGRDISTFGPLAGQVIELIADFRALAEDFKEFKEDLKQEARSQLEQVKAEAGMSTTLKVALITGSVTLLAALIAGVSQIVSNL